MSGLYITMKRMEMLATSPGAFGKHSDDADENRRIDMTYDTARIGDVTFFFYFHKYESEIERIVVSVESQPVLSYYEVNGHDMDVKWFCYSQSLEEHVERAASQLCMRKSQRDDNLALQRRQQEQTEVAAWQKLLDRFGAVPQK